MLVILRSVFAKPLFGQLCVSAVRGPRVDVAGCAGRRVPLEKLLRRVRLR
jgi:hypothetical protein